LGDVQVRVVGTQRGSITNEQGDYRITGITPGSVTVRAQRIGFTPATQTVTVVTGNPVTANFALTATAIQIDEVVVTATGESQRKRESGNTIATVTPTPERLATTTNIAEVLQAAAPGVYVNSPGGTQGSANRIRIRGASSLSLSNEPLLIVDGVRASNQIGGVAGDGTIGVGGQATSRLNDINPDDIEAIEIIKGPAAAALYGTAGANGVIQIRTKRGRAGKAKWTLTAEGGRQRDVQDYPSNYTQVGTIPSGARTTGCTLDAQSRQVCTANPDSLVSHNPLKTVNPFITGKTASVGASVSGGGDVASYYVSADVDDDHGIVEPNKFRRWSTRLNLTSQFRENISAQLSTSYIGSRLEFPQNDNNTLGILGGGLLGSAFDDSVGHGYITGQTVQELYAIDVRENVERFVGSAPLVWQVNKWLTTNATAGVDFFDRRNRQTIPPGKVMNSQSNLDGQRNANNADIWNYTANASATANFDLTPTLRSTTTSGVQYTREYIEGVRAQGSKLLGGTGSLQGAAARFVVGETNTDNRTFGGLISEQLAWRDRLFLTGALRTDRNSAFGQDFGWVSYPAASLSYVISDEDFFPKTNFLSSLRLRTAYGESGKQPNFRDAITFFNTQTITIAGADQPGITVGGTGNLNLKPEVSREIEGGFEAAFFNARAGLEVTYYQKTSTDLLIARPLPPSLGLTPTQFDNLGESQNKGWEVMLRSQLLDLRNAKFEVTATYSGNKTELTDIGRLPSGEKISPIVLGNQRHVEGYPLGGYWDESIKFTDKNGDGIITRVNCPGQSQVAGAPECEMEIGALSYLGQPLPTREISVTPRLQLYNWLQLSALIDHKGGFKVFNNTERFRCNFGNCPAAYVASSSLENQAANLGQLMNTDAGYVEDGTFTKLREVAATFTAPQSWAAKARAENMTLTFAGRNLFTWTNYKGFDPEVNSTPNANFGTSDFLTQPPLRSFTARVSVAF